MWCLHGGRMAMDMPPSGGGGDGNMMAMMRNSFFWSKDVIILFSGWPNHSLPMFVLALFFIFLLAVAVEVLSVPPALKPTMTPAMAALVQTLVHALRVALAYVVMLAVMSFNVGVLLVAVAGHAVGFFLNKFRAQAAADPPRPFPVKV